MTATLKMRKKGVLTLPKELRQKVGIEEGSIIVATATNHGILPSPKEIDVLAKLLGLAKISRKVSPSSVRRIRSLRSRVDKELELNH